MNILPSMTGDMNDTSNIRTAGVNGSVSEKCCTLDSVFDPRIPQLLPHENMYKIQIGNRLFKISGASLSSDGPSYFTRCFSGDNNGGLQGDEVLFIDRSAEVFQMIYDHLQGYCITIENEVQYTMLYADAMYYNLPRLRTFLKEIEYYFTNIGGKSFKIPKSLFRRKGDSPNYFVMTSLALYADTESVFIEKKLLRPPPQEPPYVARSPEYFNDLMRLLGGSSLEIDDSRRASLIKECRYYRFLNLEQRLIKHKIFYNPCTQSEDICIKLKDLNRGGTELPLDGKQLVCSLPGENQAFEDDRCNNSDSDTERGYSSLRNQQQQQSGHREPPLKRLRSNCGTAKSDNMSSCWNILNYARPYVDEFPRQLSFQIDEPECTLIFNKRYKTIHVCLYNGTMELFQNMFSSELLKMNIDLAESRFSTGSKPTIQLALPACLSVCDLSINGVSFPSIRSLHADNYNDEQVQNLNDLCSSELCPGFKLHITKSMWKLGVTSGRLMMIALKAECFKGAKEFCKSMDYL